MEHKEQAKIDADCEIRLGVASWDDGSKTAKSVKYTWFDKNGMAARGGEFPVDALPQVALKSVACGFLHGETRRNTNHKRPRSDAPRK